MVPHSCGNHSRSGSIFPVEASSDYLDLVTGTARRELVVIVTRSTGSACRVVFLSDAVPIKKWNDFFPSNQHAVRLQRFACPRNFRKVSARDQGWTNATEP
jgi:hypothetical protein